MNPQEKEDKGNEEQEWNPEAFPKPSPDKSPVWGTSGQGEDQS